MTGFTHDVLVLGSGFGGSLLSAILARAGQSVALVDTARHPRFAIGESSTPLADQTLARIAAAYNLPELLPLTNYGRWKAHHPELVCGLKRGFSYFGHTPDQPFDSTMQLLVAASTSDQVADTHWLRADVDAFLFRLARTCSVDCHEGATYSFNALSDGWLLEGAADGNPIRLRAPFIVDASGGSGVVLKTLGVADQSTTLNTTSHAVFAHFENVRSVADVFSELQVDQTRHPFDCDAAAVHQVLDTGWMWQLPFDDGTVSAGIVLDGRSASCAAAERDAQEIWDQTLNRFSFLKRQFDDAVVVRPAAGMQRSGRLQRLTTQAAGDSWAALPSTAGFVDPLHSTGIAHTLNGVSRLAAILTTPSGDEHRSQRLTTYSDQVISELQLIDELVEGCYAALPNFRLWSDWCMLYFTAVVSMEQLTANDVSCSFLRADDTAFRRTVAVARVALQRVMDSGVTDDACSQFEQTLRRLIQPWNNVGLLDESCEGMYAHTAPAP